MAHQVYPSKDPYIMHVQGYDPRDESKTSYIIRKLDAQGSPCTHFPIKELELRADENYYILLGKRRPAIVLQTVSSTWLNILYPEPYMWIAPAFTFKPRHKADFRYRVAAMEFPHLFYLPAQAHGLSACTWVLSGAVGCNSASRGRARRYLLARAATHTHGVRHQRPSGRGVGGSRTTLMIGCLKIHSQGLGRTPWEGSSSAAIKTRLGITNRKTADRGLLEWRVIRNS